MTNQNEQEWWDDEKYSKLHAGQEFCLVYDIKEIVAEAERRGREAAWEEAIKLIEKLSIIAQTENEIENAGKRILDDILEYYKKRIAKIMAAKLTELKKV